MSRTIMVVINEAGGGEGASEGGSGGADAVVKHSMPNPTTMHLFIRVKNLWSAQSETPVHIIFSSAWT